MYNNIHFESIGSNALKYNPLVPKFWVWVNSGLFSFISYSSHNLIRLKWKTLWTQGLSCAHDSNPGPWDGWHRWSHCTVATLVVYVIKLFFPTIKKVCSDAWTCTKMLNQCYFKPNYTQKLFISFKMAYSCCFS